jgi:hypothetical protein
MKIRKYKKSLCTHRRIQDINITSTATDTHCFISGRHNLSRSLGRCLHLLTYKRRCVQNVYASLGFINTQTTLHLLSYNNASVIPIKRKKIGLSRSPYRCFTLRKKRLFIYDSSSQKCHDPLLSSATAAVRTAAMFALCDGKKLKNERRDALWKIHQLFQQRTQGTDGLTLGCRRPIFA